MRLLSWNILQGGGKRATGIADAIVDIAPDIVSLQEFRNGKQAHHIVDALDRLSLTHRLVPDTQARTNAVLLASRHPLTATPFTDDASDDIQPHLAISANINTPAFDFKILAAHLPHKKKQIPYFNTLLDNPGLLETPAMIIGDLNCGIPFEDSDTKTFANTHLFQSLLQQGWNDVWREQHGQQAREFTWISPRGNGYRYDHCLCNAQLKPYISTVNYAHNLRESQLSDHSALVIDFQFH